MSDNRAPNKIKALHVHSGNMYGGVETVLTAIARHRNDAPDMETGFAVCFEGRYSEQLESLGLSVYLLGALRIRRPWAVLRARRRLHRVLRDDHWDVLVVHGSWGHVVFAPVARNAGIPVVYWVHDLPTCTHWLERLARRTPPDLVMANSRGTFQVVPRLFPGAPSVIQHTFASAHESRHDVVTTRAEVRREFDTPPDEFVIVITCRLEKWKGHSLLLRGLRLLADTPGWKCWVVGGVQRPHEQAYLDSLKSLARDGGIDDRVQFLGQRRDVPRILLAADVHCQPNEGPEPFGLAFVEAMLAELPVVTTAMGGALEIVEENTGYLVPPDNPEALAAALRELAASPAKRQAMGKKGRERALEEFTAQRQMVLLSEKLRIVAHGSPLAKA